MHAGSPLKIYKCNAAVFESLLTYSSARERQKFGIFLVMVFTITVAIGVFQVSICTYNGVVFLCDDVHDELWCSCNVLLR